MVYYTGRKRGNQSARWRLACARWLRRIQQEHFGNRLIASDLANPDFVKFDESFGAAGRRARSPQELGAALKAAIAAREPTLIEVPVGPMPSPWEFIHMPRVRGR